MNKTVRLFILSQNNLFSALISWLSSEFWRGQRLHGRTKVGNAQGFLFYKRPMMTVETCGPIDLSTFSIFVEPGVRAHQQGSPALEIRNVVGFASQYNKHEIFLSLRTFMCQFPPSLWDSLGGPGCCCGFGNILRGQGERSLRACLRFWGEWKTDQYMLHILHEGGHRIQERMKMRCRKFCFQTAHS